MIRPFTRFLSPLAAITLITSPLCAQPTPAPTWENIEQIIHAEAEKGFSGSVLLIRDGEVALNEGYGLANRETRVPNTPDTVFALGSTPIDFTLVAILQLVAKGTVSLDDPVSKYFDDIPEDRGFMTLDDIRNSASGLPNFPYIRGVDADPDHSPLSREQFIERFRKVKLRATPGTGREHSHFAWGVLAAVIEVATGQTYENFVQEHILTPAGMTRTGSHGQQFPGERVAIGYGFKTWGEVNTPPQWGPASWLVKGSGGMVGTTGDLRKYHIAIDTGKLIPESVIHFYPSRGVYANGNMYGFETYYNYGGDDLFYINCNSSNPAGGYTLEALADACEQLCTGRGPARFSIGIGIGRGETHPEVSEVMPGSPAQAAGLKPGDILISANGATFDLEDPLAALMPGIEHGEKLSILIRRGGETLTLDLIPTPRQP